MRLVLSENTQELLEILIRGIIRQGGPSPPYLGWTRGAVSHYVSVFPGAEMRCAVGHCLTPEAVEAVQYGGLNAMTFPELLKIRAPSGDFLFFPPPERIVSFLTDVQQVHDKSCGSRSIFFAEMEKLVERWALRMPANHYDQK